MSPLGTAQMATITEIAPDVYRISVYVRDLDLQFNHFLVKDGELLETGKYRFRLLHTAHLPHGWEAGMLFEETQRTLFCSDLFHQSGDVEPSTESDLIGRFRDVLTRYQAGPLKGYMPYTPQTARMLADLASWHPQTLAVMHGSSFIGDGVQALLDLDLLLKELLGS